MSSLYEQLGGEPTIELLVTKFYQRVLADPMLAPMFDGIDPARLEQHQRRFLAVALGGPNAYQGRDLTTAHTHIARKHGLSDLHFDAVLKHLAATLRALNADESAVTQVMAIAESTRAMVLGRQPQAAVA